jgi:uncharacterized linocin/CFP29 family protein
MNHLRRGLSPVVPAAYDYVEAEARDALKIYFAARKLVDFDGPHGWGHAAVNLGRTREPFAPHIPDVQARLRATLPLLEVRVPFELPLDELDAVERGAVDLELEPAVEAARKLALVEDRAVFYGLEAAQIQGIIPSATHEPIALSPDFQEFPALVSEAIAGLHRAGVGGPYAIALDADAYTALSRAAGDGGYPVLQHIRRLVEGPTVWAPALAGALVLSMRGGDFQLTVGQDAAIGYLGQDQNKVLLYLEESFTFRVLRPEAAVALPLKVMPSQP